MYKTREDRPLLIEFINFTVYYIFLFSLFCIVKPLAYIVDITSIDDEVHFLDE